MPNTTRKCSHTGCQFTGQTSTFYNHLVNTHPEETLRNAKAKIATGQKLHKAEQIVLIGKNAKGKWTPIETSKAVLNAMLQQRFADRHETDQVKQDVTQVKQDVTQVKANVAHIQDEVALAHGKADHIHEEVAELRHVLASVQRTQQEHQEQIRRVDEEQKRHARILDDMLQRLRDEREARLRLDADTSRAIETLTLRVGELTQERYRE